MLSRLFNNTWFIGFLLVLAIYYVITNALLPYWQRGQISADFSFSGLEESMTNEIDVGQGINKVDIEALQWQQAFSRDPFSAASLSGNKQLSFKTEKALQTVVRLKPRPNFKLKSIAVGGQTQLAVINNRVLALGDVIKGYTVSLITAQAVALKHQQDGVMITLSME